MTSVSTILESRDNQLDEKLSNKPPELENLRTCTPGKYFWKENIAYVSGEAPDNSYNNGKRLEDLKPNEVASFEVSTQVGKAYVVTKAAAGEAHTPQDAAGVVNVAPGRTIISVNDGVTGFDPKSGEILGHRSGALARKALAKLGEYDPNAMPIHQYVQKVIQPELLKDMDKVGDMASDTLMQFADVQKKTNGRYKVDFYYLGREKDVGYCFAVDRAGRIQQKADLEYRNRNAGILASSEMTGWGLDDVEPGTTIVVCSDGFKKKIPPDDSLGYLKDIYDEKSGLDVKDDASYALVVLK